MYLAVTLNRLDDFENACSAYEKARRRNRNHVHRLDCDAHEMSARFLGTTS